MLHQKESLVVTSTTYCADVADSKNDSSVLTCDLPIPSLYECGAAPHLSSGSLLTDGFQETWGTSATAWQVFPEGKAQQHNNNDDGGGNNKTHWLLTNKCMLSQ